MKEETMTPSDVEFDASCCTVSIGGKGIGVLMIRYEDGAPGSIRMRSSLARKMLEEHGAGPHEVTVAMHHPEIGSEEDTIVGLRIVGACAAVDATERAAAVVEFEITYDEILWTRRRVRLRNQPPAVTITAGSDVAAADVEEALRRLLARIRQETVASS